jgi:hypothetical protein
LYEDKVIGQTAVLFFRGDDVDPEIGKKVMEVRRLLKLPAEGQKYTLLYSPVRGGPGELAVNSRSMLQVMAAFSSYIEAPEAHLKNHSAMPGIPRTADRVAPVAIHSGKDKPADAFVAVRYRDYWFWIYESDWKTKRALTAVMFFFTLAETGSSDKLPLITIPAQ